MRRSVCLPLALLFLASVLPSYAQSLAPGGGAGAATATPERDVLVQVAVGAPLTVECLLGVEQRLEWRLDGRHPPADARPAGEAPAPAAAAALTARLHVPAAAARHAGVYTCGVGPSPQRVHVAVLPTVDVSTTEAAAGAAAGAAVAAGGGVSVVEGNELLYDVRGLLTINCSDLVVPGVKLVWKINGTLLSELPDAARARVLVSEAGVLSVARTTEDDFGNYSCAGGERAPREFAVRGRPHARMPENANVVEGHKLKLTCRLGGKPYVAVEWLYAANETEAGGAGAAPLAAGRGERRPNEQGVEGAQLVLDDARAADAGYYHCRPAHPAGVAARTHLRVKDKYAALWPFLGICAEVFVLCAIILVYEKRRTKPELDDSDTDNHDQKKS